MPCHNDTYLNLRAGQVVIVLPGPSYTVYHFVSAAMAVALALPRSLPASVAGAALAAAAQAMRRSPRRICIVVDDLCAGGPDIPEQGVRWCGETQKNPSRVSLKRGELVSRGSMRRSFRQVRREVGYSGTRACFSRYHPSRPPYHPSRVFARNSRLSVNFWTLYNIKLTLQRNKGLEGDYDWLGAFDRSKDEPFSSTRGSVSPRRARRRSLRDSRLLVQGWKGEIAAFTGDLCLPWHWVSVTTFMAVGP